MGVRCVTDVYQMMCHMVCHMVIAAAAADLVEQREGTWACILCMISVTTHMQPCVACSVAIANNYAYAYIHSACHAIQTSWM